MAALSGSTWGNPAATRRILLIHSITSSSRIWYRIAEEFTSRGYFVVAPDLLGHGNARRSLDYTVAALAEELRPLFSTSAGDDHPFHIVIGHSLGGVVACALLPLLRCTRSVRVVLVDPPLEQTPELVVHYRKMLGDIVRHPKTPEAHLQEHPHWTREDATSTFLSIRSCDAAAVDAILDQNVPWSFSHQLSAIPDNVKVVVLTAHPSKVREEDLKPYPHVTVKTVRCASPLIPLEAPQVVVETALEGIELQA